MTQAKRTCVVIAGMHRSGTSALARVLNLLGCGLAKELLDANPTNETGHWEPLQIMKLNDELLESAGSFWDDWTACSPDWFISPVADEFKERAARIFAEQHGTQRLTVMKDPRLARLLPFWLKSLRAADVDPVVMIPIRNPLEVAQSLHVRDGSDPFYNQLLWLRHVLDAEAGSRGVARHFSTYDQLLDSWTSLISAAEGKLGFKFPRRSARTSEEVDAYLADRHRHQRLNPKAVLADAATSDLLKSTYAIMLKWSESGEDREDYAQLDSVRSELDRAAGTFSRLIYRGKKAVEEVNALRHVLAERDQQVASLSGELERASHLANQRDHEVSALQNQMSAEHARIADLEGQLQAAIAARASLTESAAATEASYQAQLADLDARLHHTQSELAATHDQLSTVQSACEAERVEAESKLAASYAETSSLHAHVANLEANLSQEQALGLSLREQVSELLQAIESSKGEAEATRTGLEKSLEEEQAIVKGLTDHVALLLKDIDSAKQAGETAVQSISTELKAAHSNLQATTDELNEALAARAAKDAQIEQLISDLAQLDSAMRQRGAELDDVRSELHRLENEIETERSQRAQANRVAEGLKAHVNMLAADVEALRAERNKLERKLEIVETRLLAQTKGLMNGLINEPYRPFMTRGGNLRRKAALLRETNIIDTEAYLRLNPDVASAGVAPEIHYLTAGFAEGRRVNQDK